MNHFRENRLDYITFLGQFSKFSHVPRLQKVQGPEGVEYQRYAYHSDHLICVYLRPYYNNCCCY